MQSGQKSPALLHDMAEMLICKGRRLGHSSMEKKKKKGSDYAAPSTAGAFLYKCGKQGGMINSQPVGYRAKEPWVRP